MYLAVCVIRLLAEANSGPVAPVGSLMKTPMKCLSCDQNLPYTHMSRDDDLASSPEHRSHHHQSQHHTCTHKPQTPEFYYYAQPPGSTEPNFRELFATSFTAAASRRRKQRQLNLSLALSSNNPTWSDGAGLSSSSSRAFVNLDDGRNRIPLRRTVLSDHVVYGPAITPNAFKKRTFVSGATGNRILETECVQPESYAVVVSGSTDEPLVSITLLFSLCSQQRTSRPKTAIPPDRRGEIITRSVSSTVRHSLYASSSLSAMAMYSTDIQYRVGSRTGRHPAIRRAAARRRVREAVQALSIAT